MFSDCEQEGMTEEKKTNTSIFFNWPNKNNHVKIYFESEPATDMFFESDETNGATVQLVSFDSFGQSTRCCWKAV